MGSPLENILINLSKCSDVEAKNEISNIKKYFSEELGKSDLDCAFSRLFAEDNGIITFLSKKLRCKDYGTALVETFELLEYIVIHFHEKTDHHILDIKSVCMSCIVLDQTSADQKERSFDVLKTIFENGPWGHDLEIPSIITKLIQQLIRKKPKPKVLQKEYHVLGVIARRHPEHMAHHSDTLLRLFLDDLDFQTTRASYVSFPLIAGCLNGLTEFLYSFSQSPEDSPENCRRIYTYVKKLSEPGQGRRVAQRAALNLVSIHGCQLSQHLYKDYQLWHDILLKWLDLGDKDCKVAIKALGSFYRQIARTLHESKHGNEQAVFQYFMKFFKEKMLSASTSKQEIHIIIKGFGLFAGPCQTHMDPKDVTFMFTLIVQQAEQLYMKETSDKDNSLYHLADYVESLASIIIQLGNVSTDQLAALQRVTILLVQRFPDLPQSLHYPAIYSFTATCQNLVNCSLSLLNMFLSKVVYQGVIRTCSHPRAALVESQKDQVSTGANKLVSYKSYLPLWTALLQIQKFDKTELPLVVKQSIINNIYDEFVKTVITLTGKLNLETKNKTAIEDDIQVLDPETGLDPCCQKDFQVFFNLVDLFCDLVTSADPDLFEKWIQPFLHHVVLQSLHQPIISGFYKLIAVSMHLCVKLQYFKNYCGDLSDHRRPCYLLLSKFLLGLLAHCKQYKGDLQVSCLQAILETPAELVQPLIPQAISAFQVMFRLGHSMLSLAQQALTTLEQWCQLLPAEDMKPLLTAVLPELDPYLQSSGFEGDIEEAIDWELIKPSKNLSKNRTTKLIRKTLIERPETELSKLQRRIVIFLGCLETDTCLSLIEGGKKVQCDVWDSSQHLAYAIPFIDMKPSINIDNILPRVIELCLGCSDRQTRIVACEFLHAVIMYMLGTNLKMEVSKPGYLSKMFSHMVMPLLQLGCDSDQIVHQLYHPLMLQLAHWYSSAVQLGSVHTQILIETLMDGITHPTDTALRDYSAKCLREFVIWSIKQSIAKDLEKSQTNIKAVLKKMFSLCVHPSPTKRLGGALVFNSIYSVLREEKSILEIFWLEILYYLVSNLAMTDGPDSTSVNVNSQVVLALDHVERVFLEKSALFTQVNSKRRTPPGFLGSCLVDVVMWLLHQCSSSSPDCRHKCMHMVCRICLKLPGISSVAAYMNMYNQLQLLDICEKKTMVSTSPSSDAAGGSLCDQIVHWLNRLLTSLDCYVWLLGEDFVPLHKLFQVPENAQPTIKIFQALAHFIEHICSVPLSELLGRDSIYLLPRDEERYNRIKCFVTVRLCDFTRAILQHPDGSIYIPSTFPITKLWSLVATCIFHPSKVGFDMRSIEVLEKLPGNLQDLLQVIKNTDCLEELVKIIDEIMGDGYEQLLNELQYNLKNDLIPEWQTLYIQGMCTMQISGLIEYLKIDISAEKVVTTIFSALVETDGSSKMLIPLQPTAQAYAESLLKFAFLLHNQVDILVELVMNDSKLLIHHSQTSLSHGEHFLLTFKTTILSHWLMYPDHCIGLLLDRVDSQCGRMVLGVLTEFLQFAAHNKRHKHRVSMAAEKVVTNRWDTLQEWGNANPDNAYRLLGVLCDMAATQQNAIGCLMKHKSVCDWVMIQISSQNLTMNHKNHALDLLPCLTSPVEDINHELTTSLKALKHQHFPHRSSELVKDSLEYIGFMLAFHKLLTGLEVTGSRVLLHAVVALSTSDPHHICEDSIQRTLKSFICRLQREDQLKAVEVPYQVFLSTDYDPVIRLGAVERFCRSMLLCCSEAVVRQFLCSHVQALRELLDEKMSGASGVKNEHQLVGKIGAWMLMGVMFSQLDPQELESVDCPITRAAMTGPVITGKELIVHLTKGAFNARCENTPPAPSIDSRVPDLFRQYQCTAYNTLVTIVSNTKRSAAELKFYQGFLFTENRDKNQLLWEKLVDCSRTYTFPMDWEEIPKRRKKMVGIRRMACQSGSTEVNYLPTHSQYLFDSTLREDVTQFDFTTSLVLSDGVTLPHSDVPDSLEVTLESDSLNEHECMSTLCGLIQHMVQCGISPLPQENEQPTSLPGWMDMLKKSLEDEYKHKNAKVFILKLIVNCETVFKPYAKFWLSPIMKALLDRCAGTDMNYFLIDIIAMLLSWYDVAIPQSSDVFASEILHFLIANIHHNRRDIFKHNLDVIKTLVEVWKPCLSIPKQQLLDGIVPKGGPDSRDTETGIQLVGVMLANDIHPWSETGKKLFLDKLLSNMDSNQREVFLPCAEVVGMSLKILGTNLNIAQLPESDSSFLENVNSKLNKIKIHNKLDKFIFCLHGIYKHFSTIVDGFMPVILFHIKKVAGMFRVLCLEMMHSRLETIQQSLYLTLVDVGLMEYLRNRESDVQELALKIVRQAAPRIEPTQLALIFPEVCRFGSHGVLACRRVMYEIAMWVYSEFRQRIDESDVEMSLFEESKVILLRGLVDSDSALQETVFKFWNTDAHFPAGTAHRLITLLTELYSPRTEPNFLAYSTQLLLEATALGPDFNRKIFDHPLSACKFEDLKVLVSWRAQHTSIAPMFAETFVSQPNTQAPGSLDMVVRATQTSLEFQPTLDQGEDVVDTSNTSFSSFANSSLLFSVGSLGDKSRRARARRGDQQLDNSAEVVNSNPSSSYLRRRFLKDKEKIRIGFASREVLRKHRREEHLKERAKKREATVNMYRSYRIGDLPDIEILHSALIQPLRVLAKRDSSIGRQLLVSLFSGILVEMGDGADWFTARSAEALGDILSSSTLSCPPVIGTVLEIALANSQHINLDIESITTASRSSGLLALGSLLLEQMLMKGADEGQRPPKRARVRTDTGQQLWLKLAELYGHLDEWDVVRGIFRDKVQCGDSVEEALLAEATGFWREARDLYQETLQDSECLVHDYCHQALYKCLAHLSDWDRLNTNVKSQAADGDLDQLWKDSWCQEQILPWLFSSEMQLKLSQVDPTGETVASWPFLATIQKWLDDEDKAQHLRYNYSYMLALMCTLKRDFELANYHAAQDLTLFLETWSHLSPLEDKLRTASMLDLQRAADMHVYLEFAGATNNARYQQKVTTIVDRWSHTLPCTADSLLHWDKRVMTRCGFIAQMKGRLIPMGQQSELLVQRIKNLQTEMELSLIDTALAQSNFYVARKFLERTKSKVTGGDMEQSVRWGLYFSRAKWLRAELEDEPANKLKWTLAAWMQLDDLLESRGSQNDCTLHISIQQHQSVLAQGATHHISTAPHILADIDPVSLDGLTRRVSADSQSPEALIEGLKEFGLSCLLKATQLVKTDSLPGHQNTLVAETYLLLAQYCRSMVECDDGNQSVIYDNHIVTSILRAMKRGSRQARQLFPCLLQISSIANINKETFQKESSDVPEWMFLGWVSQLIASLDTPVGLALGDLILRLATSYPKAVIYPFYISSDKYKFKDGESAHHTRCLIDRLKGVLKTSSLQDTLLKAFSCVAQPPLILKYHLDILIKFLEDEVPSLHKLRSSFHDMMAEVFSSNTSGETKLHGSVFKTVMSFKDTLLKILGENCDKVKGRNVRSVIQALKEEKVKVSNFMDSYSKKIPKLLKDFCPWLEEFQGAKMNEELEIPGQYTGEQRPLPQFHVKILGFGSQVLVMTSLRYPLRLTILGNDAKEHHYLVKFGEDLRQDQRIQQLLRLMNEILHNDAACHHHNLNICTYQVVPLTSKVGIIEWVNETKPLKQFFTDHLNQEEEMMYHQIRPLFVKWMCSVSRNKDIQAKERYETAYLKFNRDETVTKFQELTNRLPWDIFRRGLLSLSSSPEVFFSLRHNFVLSYATMCISHWFLGIGDRHLHNCLVSQKDARCVAIDFGHSFGTATQFLPVPELFPFRLTPHIVSMMQPLEQTGFLRESMIHVVRALRKNHSILLATMEVFVLEPSIDWLELARKQNKNIHASTSFRKVDEDSWFPRQKVSLARKKFEGANPAAITEEELQTGIMSSSVALKKILEVARGDAEHNIRAKLPDMNLTPEKQVDCLLDQATDYHLLGMSWDGWEPWV